MSAPLPYCGAPPLPAELLGRFNLDPILIASLIGVAAVHMACAKSSAGRRHALIGWSVAAAAFISPLCALSVSLFAARIAQHAVLLLIAAPLIAFALPPPSRRYERQALWLSVSVFFFALWFWHMPTPYDATFTSTGIYWLMHTSLFGSGILLWRALLHHGPDVTADVLTAGVLTSTQMGLLGAVLTLAAKPMFYPHLLTTYAWGMTPLQDQQLGGAIMWVPGMIFFLWVSLRSLRRLWVLLEQPDHAP